MGSTTWAVARRSLDRGQHEVEDWERLADAINGALGARRFQSTDELRRP